MKSSVRVEPHSANAATGARLGPPVGIVREFEVDGGLTIYRRDIERVLVLNSTASDVWRLCDGSLSEPEIIERLAQAYEVSNETISTDVRSTLRELVGEGFLAITGP